MLAVLLALMIAQAPAEEGSEPDAATMAEYYRLSDEMKKLSKRQIWEGVERHYESLEELHVPLDYDDYVAGAMAARHQGEVMVAYERLQEAAKLNGTREVIEWLWSIDTAYGRVSLCTQPVAPSQLSVQVMPLLPDQRAAIDAAVRKVEEVGCYDGMLPEGEYVFAEQSFSVTPGPKAVTIVVEPVELKESRRHLWAFNA